MIEVSFTATKNMDRAEPVFTSSIRDFMQSEPLIFNNIIAGERVVGRLLIAVPSDIRQKALAGTIQLQTDKKLIPKPLPIVVGVIEATQVEEALTNLLLEEFGTLTPQVPAGDRYLAMSFPIEMEELILQGTNQPMAFRVGSLHFILSPSLEVNPELTSSAGELANESLNKGIRVESLRDVLSSTKWHKEDLSSPLIANGAVAITFVPPGTLYDQDGNGVPETLFIIPTDTTHIILDPVDVERLIVDGPVDAAGITSAGLTAIHELMHVVNFRTKCGGSSWDGTQDEEDFISTGGIFTFEKLVQDIFSNKSPAVLNENVDILVSNYPNAVPCLDLLDLTRPVPSTLSVSDVTASAISLTWSQNSDRDFASYALLRDGAVVFTTDDVSELAFTDTNLSPATSYTYVLRATDQVGLTSDSAIAPATTSPPPITLSNTGPIFSEDCFGYEFSPTPSGSGRIEVATAVMLSPSQDLIFDQAQILLSKDGATDDVRVKVQTGFPNGTVIAETVVPNSVLPIWSHALRTNPVPVTVYFAEPVTLLAGNNYYIVFERTGPLANWQAHRCDFPTTLKPHDNFILQWTGTDHPMLTRYILNSEGEVHSSTVSDYWIILSWVANS